MQSQEFPASAATSLIEGYYEDFVAFAATLGQTLEQVSMRGIDLGSSLEKLERMQTGMRGLAEAIGGMLAAGASARRARGATRSGGSPMPAPPPAPGPRKPAPARPGAPRGPAASGGGRCVLRGTVDEMPLLSVCQFLGRSRKNGTLRLHTGDEAITFRFVEGRPVGSTSTGGPPAERLEALVTGMGFCSRSALQDIVANACAGGRSLAESLVQTGLVTQKQLLEAREQQVQRRLARVCKQRDASYEFEEVVGS